MVLMKLELRSLYLKYKLFGLKTALILHLVFKGDIPFFTPPPPQPLFKADTHEGFCSQSMFQSHFARVSTHEGAFSSSLNLPRELAPKYLTGPKYHGAFCGVEILLPKMKYTHEIVGTHGGGLLPERAPEHALGAKSFVCTGL